MSNSEDVQCLQSKTTNVSTGFPSTPQQRNKKREQERNMEDTETQLQSALHFAVGQLCLSIEQKQERDLQLQPKPSDSLRTQAKTYVRMSTEAISALTDLTFQYVTTSLANDLVSFSKHANRRTISADDVKLVARKEPIKLLRALQNFENNNNGKNHNKTYRMQEDENNVMTNRKNQIYEIDSSSSGSSKSVMSSSSELEVDLKNVRKNDKTIKNDYKRRRMIDVEKSDLSDTTDEIEVNEKGFKFVFSCSSSGDDS